MEYSRRTSEIGFWEEENQLTRTKFTRNSSGLPVYDLTETNPTILGLEFPWSDLLSTLHYEDFSEYNPEPQGLLSSRKFLAGSSIIPAEPDDFYFASSTSEAISYLIKLFCDPGDSILIPTPGYPLFPHIISLEANHPIEVPLLKENKLWVYDIGAFEKAILPNTKMILLVHPSNPTGAYLTDKNWNELGEISRKYQIPIVADIVFLNHKLEVGNFPLPISFQGILFLVQGISKWLCLPQWKLAWIQVVASANLKTEIQKGLSGITDIYLSTNSFAQKKLEQLVSWQDVVLKQWKSRVKRNISMIESLFVEKNSKFKLEFSEALPYGRLVAEKLDEEWCCKLLEETGIYTYPGEWFGFKNEESCLLFSLLEANDNLLDKMEILLGWSSKNRR